MTKSIFGRMPTVVTAMVLALLPLVGSAQDFDKGLAAHNAGDFATALKEWAPLAELGNTGAQYHLGLMYKRGEGVTKDNAEAARWFHLAAEQGVPAARQELDMLFAPDLGTEIVHASTDIRFVSSAIYQNGLRAAAGKTEK